MKKPRCVYVVARWWFPDGVALVLRSFAHRSEYYIGMMKMKRLGEASLNRRTGRVQVEILTTTESGTGDTY